MSILVLDEIDIIRANLDFHFSQGVDFVVAIDNGSTDGTREVLMEYQMQGRLHLIDEPDRDFNQTKWMTNAAVVARDVFDADWVLNNDADEFWVTTEGNLKDYVAAQSVTALLCPRRNLFCGLEDIGTDSWLNANRFRVKTPVSMPVLSDPYAHEFSCPFLYLDVAPKVLCRTHGLKKVLQGNHDVVFEGEITSKRSEIWIYHCPLRSADQFKRKIEAGGVAYERNSSFSPGVGWTWRRWFRLLQNEGIESVLEDLVPCTERLQRDVEDGVVIKDKKLLEVLGGSQNPDI